MSCCHCVIVTGGETSPTLRGAVGCYCSSIEFCRAPSRELIISEPPRIVSSSGRLIRVPCLSLTSRLGQTCTVPPIRCKPPLHPVANPQRDYPAFAILVIKSGSNDGAMSLQTIQDHIPPPCAYYTTHRRRLNKTPSQI